MRILVVNAGSSSLKLRVIDQADALVASADLPPPDASAGGVGGAAAAAAVAEAIRGFGAVDAVGHRVVHGGSDFVEPVMIDAGVRERLSALTDLAPLHQPKSLAALDAVSAVLPGVPAVACFDTAFHATIPAAAATYALPREWRERWPLRRFGFHGLSHAYASQRVARMIGGAPGERGRVVTCHLGAGASLAAVLDGRSVDTTMGFTPLAGLVMATRSGDVDPGLILWLEEHEHLSTLEVAAALERQSGLLGLAGTSDMREVLVRAAAGDVAATLALAVYVHRLRSAVGWMTASLGGLDVLVFTGGVGEHAPVIRQRTAEGLAFLGVALDATENDATDPGDREITSAGASVRVFVIEAREDLEIAREVRGLLG